MNESKKKNTERKMSDAAREARNQYLRLWRQRNKEKQAEYSNRYWEKKAAAEAGQE